MTITPRRAHADGPLALRAAWLRPSTLPTGAHCCNTAVLVQVVYRTVMNFVGLLLHLVCKSLSTAFLDFRTLNYLSMGSERTRQGAMKDLQNGR